MEAWPPHMAGPSSWIAATATASWFNDYGKAAFFEPNENSLAVAPIDPQSPSKQIARQQPALSPSSALHSPARQSASFAKPSLSPGNALASSPKFAPLVPTEPSSTRLAPAKVATPNIKSNQPLVPTRDPVETPDPFRAAAARARRVQHELQQAQRFKSFDGDGDGKMDAKELQELLNLETEEEAAAIIERLDVDGDGGLDLSEVGDALASVRAKLSQVVDVSESEASHVAGMARAAAGLARKSLIRGVW